MLAHLTRVCPTQLKWNGLDIVTCQLESGKHYTIAFLKNDAQQRVIQIALYAHKDAADLITTFDSAISPIIPVATRAVIRQSISAPRKPYETDVSRDLEKGLWYHWRSEDGVQHLRWSLDVPLELSNLPAKS